MRSLLRRLVVLLAALAFVTGSAIGVATPTTAAEPCPPEHGDMHGHSGGHQPGHGGQHRHDSDPRAALQCCCVGICVSVPNLPVALTIAPVSVMPVAYWDTTRFSVGRSITPEPGPPRPLA